MKALWNGEKGGCMNVWADTGRMLPGRRSSKWQVSVESSGNAIPLHTRLWGLCLDTAHKEKLSHLRGNLFQSFSQVWFAPTNHSYPQVPEDSFTLNSNSFLFSWVGLWCRITVCFLAVVNWAGPRRNSGTTTTLASRLGQNQPSIALPLSLTLILP